MINWEVKYTQQAEADLRNVYEYIAFSLLEEEVAKQQLNRMMNAIKSLNKMAFRYKVYENDPWHSIGIRVLPVDNYLVFYLPVEKTLTVVIIRIMYGGSNIDQHIRTVRY